MSIPVPSLSASGWVEDIAEKADRLISYYFVSEDSQSTMYKGNITSLTKEIQEFGNDELELRRVVREHVERFLSRYFDIATVKVSTDKPAPADPNRTNITLDVIVTQDNVQYSLGRLIQTNNGKITQIADINNFKGAL